VVEHEPDCSFAERGINLLWHDAILSTQKEAASKPGRFSGVAVGVRIDLFDQGEQYLGSILREDLRAAGVPRVGDNLGRGTLGLRYISSLGSHSRWIMSTTISPSPAYVTGNR